MNENRYQFFDKSLSEKGIDSSDVKLVVNKIKFLFTYIAENSIDFIKLYNQWCSIDSDGKELDRIMEAL